MVPIKSAMVPQTMANQTVAISKADEKPGLSHSATKSADEFGQAYHDARLAFRHFDAEWTGALAATEDDERNALATLARFCVIADRHADRRLKWLNEQGVKPHAGAKSRYHVITKAMVFSAAKGSRRDIMRRLGQRLTKFAGAIDQAAAMAHGDPDHAGELLRKHGYAPLYTAFARRNKPPVPDLHSWRRRLDEYLTKLGVSAEDRTRIAAIVRPYVEPPRKEEF
ncbi:MAG TPA: hypothetical protein VF957_23385 [Bradyrhizobium sp.]